MSVIVTIDELKTITGYTRPGDVEKCLRQNGVRFLYGRGGRVFTTIDAINVAMGLELGKQPNNDSDIEFEFL